MTAAYHDMIIGQHADRTVRRLLRDLDSKDETMLVLAVALSYLFINGDAEKVTEARLDELLALIRDRTLQMMRQRQAS